LFGQKPLGRNLKKVDSNKVGPIRRAINVASPPPLSTAEINLSGFQGQVGCFVIPTCQPDEAAANIQQREIISPSIAPLRHKICSHMHTEGKTAQEQHRRRTYSGCRRLKITSLKSVVDKERASIRSFSEWPELKRP
jgi:hypothetical protein